MVWPMEVFYSVIQSIGDVLIDASFYLLLGLFLAGIAKAILPANFVSRHIGQPTTASILKASIIGVPMPLCSCSVIPMAVSLREKGASKGATTSFLISAPETGVDSVAVSYAMLDPLMTIFRPFAAFVTAFLAGCLENAQRGPSTAEMPTPVENCNCCTDKPSNAPTPKSLTKRLLGGVRYAFGDLLPDIAYYLVIGLVVSGLIAALIPEDFFTRSQLSNAAMMFTMLIVGIPVYVCASASTPIAAALIIKGLSPGAALVFLLAGPATNLSSVGLVRKMLGNRSLGIYLVSISIAALGCGVLLDSIYHVFSIPIQMNLGIASEIIPSSVKIVSAALLLPLLMWGFLKEIRHRIRRFQK